MRWRPPARERGRHRLRVRARCRGCDRRTRHLLRERQRQFAIAFYLVCAACRRVRLLSQQPTERAA